MKAKLFILSIFMGIFMTSANAGFDGNPWYRPAPQKVVTHSSVATGNETSRGIAKNFQGWSLIESVDYGVTCDFSLGLETSGSYDRSRDNEWSWDNLKANASWRFFDKGIYKADLYGSVGRYFLNLNGLHTVANEWMAGTQFGIDTKDFAITVHGSFFDIMARNISDNEFWVVNTGIDALYKMTSSFNIVTGIAYETDLSSIEANEISEYEDDSLKFKAGANYTLTNNAYVGAYATYDLKADNSDEKWGFKATLGVKF